MRRVLSVAVALVAVGASVTAGPAAALSGQSMLTDLAKLTDRTLTYTTTVLDAAGEIETATTETVTLNKRGDQVRADSETVDGGGVVISSFGTSTVYDSAGRVLSSTSIQDGDGERSGPPQTVTRTLTYDTKGTLVSTTTKVDVTTDGVIDRTSIDTFDNSNRLVSTYTQQVLDEGGLLLFSATDTLTFNRKGSLVESRQTFEEDPSTPGPEFESVTVFTYDSARRLLTRDTTATDSGLTTSTTLRNTYDSRGNRIAGTLIQTGNGTTELVEDTATFDSKNREITRSRARTVDGTLFDVITVATSYDSKGRVVREVTQSDELQNGPGTDEIQTVDFTYDSKGRLVGDVTSIDDRTNGEGIDQVLTNTYTYDSKGRLASYTFTEQVPEDLASSISGTVTYDGATTTETQQIDQDGDGIIDRTVIITTPTS